MIRLKMSKRAKETVWWLAGVFVVFFLLLGIAFQLEAAEAADISRLRPPDPAAEMRLEVLREYIMPCYTVMVWAGLGKAQTLVDVVQSDLLEELLLKSAMLRKEMAELLAADTAANRQREHDKALAECVRQAFSGEK